MVRKTKFSCTLQWVFGTAHPLRKLLKREVMLTKFNSKLAFEISLFTPQTSPPSRCNSQVTGLKPRDLGSGASLQVSSPVLPNFRMLWSEQARLRQECLLPSSPYRSPTVNTDQLSGNISREHGQCLGVDPRWAKTAALILAVAVMGQALALTTTYQGCFLMHKLGQKKRFCRKLSKVW